MLLQSMVLKWFLIEHNLYTLIADYFVLESSVLYINMSYCILYIKFLHD